MRCLVAVLLVAPLAVVGGHPSSTLDTPVPRFRVAPLRPEAPCDVWRTVEHIARFAGVRVGFEHTPDCVPSGWSRRAGDDAIVIDGWSAREALDYLVRERPEFTWREIDGVAVTRPKTAWTDPANVLHRPVAAVSIVRTPPHHALHRLFAAATPSLYLEHDDLTFSADGMRLDGPPRLIDRPIDVGFAGGVMLQALNAVAGARHASWEVGYWGKPHVALYAPDFDGGTTGLSMRFARQSPPPAQ